MIKLIITRNPKCARGWGIRDVRNEPSAMGARCWINLGLFSVAVYR